MVGSNSLVEIDRSQEKSVTSTILSYGFSKDFTASDGDERLKTAMFVE